MAAEHFLFAEPDLRDHRGDQRPLPRRERTAGAVAARQTSRRTAVGPLYSAPEQVVIGQREEDLAPVAVDFAAQPADDGVRRHQVGQDDPAAAPDPHDPRRTRHGRTDVAFTVIDRRLHLVDEPLFPDNEYTPNIDRITPAMLGLAALIEKRRPPAGLSPQELSGWTLPAGHTHYLIIDDVDQIPDAPGGQRALCRTAAVDRALGCCPKPANWDCA